MQMKEESLNQLLESNEIKDLTLSYSKLSDFDRNGAISLIRRNSTEGAAVKHGSLVDDLLVDNMTGSSLCNDKYYKFDGNKPSATLGSLCDVILANYLTIPTDLDDIVEIIKLNNFWSNIKDHNTLIKKFDNKEFWNYINAMYEVGEKILITTEEYMDAIEMVSILKNHKYSKDVIINDYENIYQHRFEMPYKGFLMRGILDLISIDHNNKIVYFTDLKTGKAPAIEFEDSFIKWRYYFQGAIYKLASKKILEDLEGAELLYATYETGNYEGHSNILYKKDGKFYENYGSHCSCYGLEGQWSPTEVRVEDLEFRVNISDVVKPALNNNSFA